MQKWEYYWLVIKRSDSLSGSLIEADLGKGERYRNREILQYMNRLGEDGWELVTSMQTHKPYGETRGIYLLFKRPKAAPS